MYRDVGCSLLMIHNDVTKEDLFPFISSHPPFLITLLSLLWYYVQSKEYQTVFIYTFFFLFLLSFIHSISYLNEKKKTGRRSGEKESVRAESAGSSYSLSLLSLTFFSGSLSLSLCVKLRYEKM